MSGHDAVKEVAEVDLSVEEDSPQTLSSLTTERGLITYAGISSSSTDQKAGRNDHLRSFDVEFPPRKRAKIDSSIETTDNAAKAGRIISAAKSQLFHPPPSTFRNPRTYQRLMRLSPVKSRKVAAKRIGAIGTADAAQNEIVLFDATTFKPNEASILSRLNLDSEAEDLDLFEYEEGSFGLAYCTNYEVYLYPVTCDFSNKSSSPTVKEPILIHTVPKPPGSKPRPKIRCLRWLTFTHLILLQNTQPAGRPELLILRIDPTSASSKIIRTHPLPKSLPIGIRLATCPLDADPASGEHQIVLAVAGQNKTIHILTLNHTPQHPDPAQRISALQSFNVLDTSSQHPQSISKIAFSNFFPPRQPMNSPRSVAGDTMYIQLCSVSVGWTVSVETLALTSKPTAPSLTAEDPVARKASTRPSVRWVLSTRHAEFVRSWFGVFVAAFGVLVLSILAQQFLAGQREREAGLEPVRGLLGRFGGMVKGAGAGGAGAVAGGSDGAGGVTATVSAEAARASVSEHSLHGLRDLLHLHRHHMRPGSDAPPAKAVLLHAPGGDNPYAPVEASAEVHHSPEELRKQGAKSFEELSERERERWKERLRKAGQWSEGEGAKVLKGVLFAEWAHVVGGAVRDAALGA